MTRFYLQPFYRFTKSTNLFANYSINKQIFITINQYTRIPTICSN